MKTTKEFEKNSIILFVIMMIGNLCNYLFQIIIGNMMTVEDFGVTNTILSIISFLSIPTTIIAMISARYIALNVEENTNERMLSALKYLYKITTYIGVILLVIGVLSVEKIARAFSLESKGLVYGSVVIAISNLLYCISTGTLQGLKRFIPYGMQGIISSFFKLIGSVLLVFIGMRVYGVLIAVCFGNVLAIVYATKYIGSDLIQAFGYKGHSVIEAKEFVPYAIGTVISQSCMIAFINGDILMVKYYFDEREAGIYSSAMVIGKIAMYVSTAVVTTLFPIVVEKNKKKESTISLLMKAMAYGGGVALLCSVGMVTLGKYVVGALFGQKYEEAIAILPFVCVYIVPLTVLTVFMNYFLAINRSNFFASIASITMVCILIGCSFGHDSIPKMMTICGAILFVVDVIISIYSFLNERMNYKDLGAEKDEV